MISSYSSSDPTTQIFQGTKNQIIQENPAMDSPQTRKAGLNLPTGMSETSLRLESFSGSFRAISNLSSPSKSSTCSDRFIPCRSSSRLYTFGLNDKASPVKEGGNEAYARLLKSELFGSDFGSFSPAGAGAGVPSPLSPSKNMLRFKTDHSAPNSPYSPSILRNDSGFSNESLTPPKPPRKVPKTPHKVTKPLFFPSLFNKLAECEAIILILFCQLIVMQYQVDLIRGNDWSLRAMLLY